MKNTQLKFYIFTQNNSGGSFDVNDKLCHRLFIEAENSDLANEKAESLGVYWNGVENDMDCPCCGDRWSYSDEVNMKSINAGWEANFKDVPEYAQMLANDYGGTSPDARIFFADGSVKEIFKQEKQINQ